MSRTKPEEHTANPTEYKLEWVGKRLGGYFKVWDRDSETEFKVELPLRFAYLDCMKSVAGYNKPVKRSFYSNEVRYTKNEELEVKYSKDGQTTVVTKGLWNDIKGLDGMKGAKFCSVVYATLLTSTSDKIPGGSLVKLPLTGTCNSAWIDLKMADGEAFEITGFEDLENGSTEYRSPVIVKIEITDDEGATADEHDTALQAFFDASKAPKANETPAEAQAAQEAIIPPNDATAPEGSDNIAVPF
jgi:hypothetical protein